MLIDEDARYPRGRRRRKIGSSRFPRAGTSWPNQRVCIQAINQHKICTYIYIYARLQRILRRACIGRVDPARAALQVASNGLREDRGLQSALNTCAARAGEVL